MFLVFETVASRSLSLAVGMIIAVSLLNLQQYACIFLEGPNAFMSQGVQNICSVCMEPSVL